MTDRESALKAAREGLLRHYRRDVISPYDVEAAAELIERERREVIEAATPAIQLEAKIAVLTWALGHLGLPLAYQGAFEGEIARLEKERGGLTWNTCEHTWEERIESDIGGNRTEVICTKCAVLGERNDETKEVFWPAT